MVASNNAKQVTQNEKRIFTAIREGLLQDPRIRQIEGHPNVSVAPDCHDESVQKETDHSEETDVTERPTKPNHPKVNENNNKIISSPSIAPAEPLVEPKLENEGRQTNETSSNRPSPAGRLFGTCVWGVFVVGMVGAGFALLSYEKQAKGIVFGAQDYLASGQLEPGFRTGSSTGSEPTLAISKPLDEKPTSDAATTLIPAGTTIPPKSVATDNGDLADVRRLLEQLVAEQEQMARDIAALQAAQQNINQQISSLAESPTVRTRGTKRSRHIGHARPQAQ